MTVPPRFPRPIPLLSGRARWYSVQGGEEGVQPDIGALSPPFEQRGWWIGWSHFATGWIGTTAHLLLYDSARGWLNIREVHGFDTSVELYAQPRWTPGYRVVRRSPAPDSGQGQHYMFYDPDQGRIDIFALTGRAGSAQLRRVRRWQGSELRGFADAVLLAGEDERARRLVLLSADRTQLHLRTVAGPLTDFRRINLNARATLLLPGRFDMNATGDDLLTQLPPNSADTPVSHVFVTWGQDSRGGLRRLASTTVGRSYAALTTLPLTVGGRSEIAGLDPASGDVVIYDAKADGRVGLLRVHRGVAVGWQRMLYVPDLDRTDPDGQPGRSLLLYRPR